MVEKKAVKWKGVQCISFEKVKQNWGKISIVVFEKMKHFHLIEKFIPGPVRVDQSINQHHQFSC